VIAIETFPADTPGWRSVPSEWEEEQPERFQRVVKKLHALAGEIVDLHADLVRVGRKHLIGVRD
jgi:broad specificity phosphatase PhoE